MHLSPCVRSYCVFEVTACLCHLPNLGDALPRPLLLRISFRNDRLKSWFTFQALVEYSLVKRKVYPGKYPGAKREESHRFLCPLKPLSYAPYQWKLYVTVRRIEFSIKWVCH